MASFFVIGFSIIAIAIVVAIMRAGLKAISEKLKDQAIQNLLKTHKDFFDHCLKYPLDRQQRRSIVSEEDNCLVVSSAGSGKTSSIIGKVKYLTEIKKIDPNHILLISYTNKAAAELTERMATPGLRGWLHLSQIGSQPDRAGNGG